MKEEYIPAIITAIAGIFGIIINVSINTWYRYADSNQKNHEKAIEALERFYIPLQQHLSRFENSFNAFKGENDTKTFLGNLSNYNAGSANLPGHLRTADSDFTAALSAVVDFIERNNFQIIKDYKSKFYFDRVWGTVSALNQSKLTKKTFDVDEIYICSVQDLNRRISHISVAIYSNNWFHKQYLLFWRNYQEKHGEI